jgi:hypothetical protein
MLANIFGIEIKYAKWNKENALPLYITESYDFQVAMMDTQKCIMLTLKDELATLPALRKHIKKIQEVDNVPVVLMLPALSSYRRQSLIENRIPFVTDKQAYLPFMGAFLVEEKEQEQEVERFMFSTQQLVLFYFYRGKRKMYMTEATESLPFSAMTMSRAVKQLESVDLFTVTKDGVNKVIEAKYDNLELFEKIKGYLSSPVRTVGYLDKSNLKENMVFAGETALSEKTMLNPSKIVTYATYHKLFDKKHLIKELVDPDRQIRLEVWEYDPKQFGDENMADSLSVVLSLIESDDERVEEAIEELLEKELKGCGEYD